MQIFQNARKDKKPTVRILTLSGTTSVTKNLTVYECGDDIIVVDCGIGFPDVDTLGVDVVIPDFTYLLDNSERIRGLFITHGHADHYGAAPFLLEELNVPVYTSKLVQGFLTESLREKRFRKIASSVKFKLISPDTPEEIVGNFRVKAFRLNHSVPSSMGFAINTPQGLIMHMADYKIDEAPVVDKPVDLEVIREISKKGVLCFLSDCLGSTSKGNSKSESTLNETFFDLFDKARDRQILVTTISTNISRMFQITTAAVKCGRKVVFSGRSIENHSVVARKLGYLPFEDKHFVSEKEAKSYEQDQLVYIVAGCFGQPGSSLGRTSRGENNNISLEKDALVIFSADPNPPGVDVAVEKLQDALILSGAEVLYSEIYENLHVSGHGPSGDLVRMAKTINPKYFIPIGGTVTKMRAYRDLIFSEGFTKNPVFELLEGESVIFSEGDAKKGDRVATSPVYINQSSPDDISPIVIKDRQVLSDDGVFVVVIPISRNEKKIIGKPEIITRGFVYVKESRALMGKSKDVVNKTIDRYKGDLSDWGKVRGSIERDVQKFLFKETGRNPLILVASVNV